MHVTDKFLFRQTSIAAYVRFFDDFGSFFFQNLSRILLGQMRRKEGQRNKIVFDLQLNGTYARVDGVLLIGKLIFYQNFDYTFFLDFAVIVLIKLVPFFNVFLKIWVYFYTISP